MTRFRLFYADDEGGAPAALRCSRGGGQAVLLYRRPPFGASDPADVFDCDYVWAANLYDLSAGRLKRTMNRLACGDSLHAPGTLMQHGSLRPGLVMRLRSDDARS